jgi:hypothetical protein
MNYNIIKSYMVKLGYDVSIPEADMFKSSLSQAAQVVGIFRKSSVMDFALVGAAVTAMASIAVGALYKYTIGVAKVDMQNQLLAAQMWMNVESATAFKNSLDALGASVNDLYLSPELMQKYIALRQEAGDITPPGGYENAMKGVRDLTFEWSRFQLEMSYGSYWIGYYLTKYIQGPLGGINLSFKGINDWIQNNMSRWSAKIASVLADVYKLLNAGALSIKTMYDYLIKLSPAAAAFLAVFAAGWMGLLNPITLVLAGIAGILLLVDDYSTWKAGGLSEFGDTWKALSNDGSMGQLGQSVSDLVANLNELFRTSSTPGSKDNFLTILFQGAQDLLDIFNKILEAIRLIKGETSISQDNAPSSKWSGDAVDPMTKHDPASSAWAATKGAVANLMRLTFKPVVTNSLGMGSNPTSAYGSQSALQRFFSLNPSSPWLNPGAATTSGVKSTTNVAYTNHQEFYIQGTSDPQAVGNAVVDKTNAAQTRMTQGVVMIG